MMRGVRAVRAAVSGLAMTTILLALPLTQSRAQVAAQEVLATHNLRAGTILSAADLKVSGIEDTAAWDLVAALVGLETRRAIYSGRPVVAADLGPPTLVRRNAVVAMLYSSNGLGIRTEGRALESGGAGEVIRVINLNSRQSVMATVIGENQVEARR
jgi:flagellar basal body P-ring formation protein FlgA